MTPHTDHTGLPASWPPVHDEPEPIVPMDLELDGWSGPAGQTEPGRDDLPLPLLPPGLLEGFGLW